MNTTRSRRARHKARRGGIVVLAAVGLLVALAVAVPAGTLAEQASQPAPSAAGRLDVSGGATDVSGHTCALVGSVLRCWGFGGDGRLGYGNTSTIGDDETPGAVAPVELGGTASAISAGAFHSCGLINAGGVRCWGFGGEGRLGYNRRDANGDVDTTPIGDNETPASAGPVDLGGTATAITAGGAHSCAVLTGGSVRCWGFGGDGRLGYNRRDANGDVDTTPIGDNETPASAGPVDLGGAATAVAAGGSHTCALLVGGSVRCWGLGGDGRLGYGNGNTTPVGDDETPASVGPVDLGGAATAITAGGFHTCALLVGGSVRCWGFGGNGRLGYGNTDRIGDDEKPSSVAPVSLGGVATAISAGDNHTCALLEGGSVRCWGFGGNGRLGYANTNDIGDNETPASPSVGAPVNLGAGRKAVAISAGGRHTCALLDDDSVRCWGFAAMGRLGYCNANDIGDDEAPGSVGPVNVTGTGACPAAAPPGAGGAGAAPAPGGYPLPVAPPRPGLSQAELYRRALAAQERRKRALGGCYSKVQRHANREQRQIRRRDSSARRARAERHIKRHRAQGRRACRKRYGRTPGRVTHLEARAVSKSKVALSFPAPGTDRGKPPAARTYVVKQSRRPIRGRRGFARARTLCRGRCRFNITLVGVKATVIVRDLRPHTTYYYSVAALDNVSARQGPHSTTVKTRTR